MGPGRAITTSLSRYATFRGRAARDEYWWFFAASVGAMLALSGVDALLVAEAATRARIEAVFSLLVFLPLVAAGARRLHDTGRSGWWMALAVGASASAKLVIEGGILNLPLFVPPVQSPAAVAAVGLAAAVPILFVLYLLARPSEPGANRLGAKS